jgi:hypothetical protein
VSGAEELKRLGRDLKDAGNKDLRKEMLRSGRRLGPPVKAEIRESALAMLPKRGGLAALIAAAKIRVSVRLQVRAVGVRFVGKWSGHDLEGIDEGKVRHPIRQRRVEKERGRKALWVSQNVPAGYWSKTFEGPAANLARREWLEAVDAMIRKLRAGG